VAKTALVYAGKYISTLVMATMTHQLFIDSDKRLGIQAQTVSMDFKKVKCRRHCIFYVVL
jgi:hypothetical protein